MIECLSFEGGGVKSFCYVGIMKYFSEHSINLNNLKVISGSSIGAFTSLCIVLGYTYEEFHDILAGFTLPNFLSVYAILKAIPNIFSHYGMLTTQTSSINKILTDIFERKNIPDTITFKQLYNIYPVDLILTASNVNKMQTEYFNYKNTPDMKVKDVCMMSMSYPLLFTPTLMNQNYYCDGGLYRNLPFGYIDLEYQQLNSIGFLLKDQSSEYEATTNIIQYILCLINGLYFNSTNSDFENDKYMMDTRICQIPIPANISSMSTLTDEQKNILSENGYNAIESFFKSSNPSSFAI